MSVGVAGSAPNVIPERVGLVESVHEGAGCGCA